MSSEFENSLEGKNPKRVLPGVIRQVRIQKNRVVGFVVVFIIACMLGIGGFVFEGIPTPAQYISLFLIPYTIFGIYADSRIYKKQKEKAKYIESVIAQSSNSVRI